MDLAEFVKTTLEQISKGVSEAAAEVKTAGGVVNPLSPYRPQRHKDAQAQAVEFDVAVTVQEDATTGAKGKISIIGLGLYGSGEVSSANTTVNRIRFRVPMELPGSEIEMKS